MKMKLKEALAELRKNEKRKFEQTIDLIINLKGIDVKRDNVSVIINLPHKFKEKKVCGFLEKKSNLVRTITKPDFVKYKDKKALKMLVKEYDFFIASAPLMPSVATTFGKVLGPLGKMPSPQLGIIAQENDSEIGKALEKISNSMKIRAKEPSIKVPIGKENLDDEKIIENFNAVYNSILNALPNNKGNVRSVMIKLTMSKPIKVEA
jgi:large subunit ribosomal protein L1